jgi:ATP-dependent protease HslVU (ClpYQ) peptidase subunit
MATKKIVEAPKKEKPQKAISNILMRIVAVFAASGLSVLGAGAVVGIDTLQAVMLAGLLGVASVIERLARAFLDDGKLTLAEINDAFKTLVDSPFRWMVYLIIPIWRGFRMTCIAVVKHEGKVYMAGDRGASDDNTILALDAPKVWKIGPYLIGYAGAMDGERIRYNFKPTAPNLKDTDKFMQTKFVKELREFYNEFWVDTSKDGDLGLIVAIRGEIYEHSSGDMSLSKYTLPYLAMGSGAEYAYGVLYATDKQKNARNRVLQAVNAAIKFSPSCMGPVDIVSA